MLSREQLDNSNDGSLSMGCLAWRSNVDGNPDLREVDEPFPTPLATCTMRQFRQFRSSAGATARWASAHLPHAVWLLG